MTAIPSPAAAPIPAPPGRASDDCRACGLVASERERLQSLLEFAPLLICEVSAQGALRSLNSAAARALGLPVASLLGRAWGDLFGLSQEHLKVAGLLASATGSLPPAAHELSLINAAGEIRWVSWTAMSAAATATHPAGLFLFGVDVTDRVASVQALEDSRQAALAASQAKSQFLANMSHEIRTPMTAILGYAELLVGEEGLDRAPPHRREAIQAMQRNCTHLLGLVNDILDLSKIEADRIDVERIECSPRQVLEDVCSLLAGKAHAKGLKLRLEGQDSLPGAVLSDPLRLRQILVNLVGNALKFTETGGVTITAACRPESEHVHRLEISVIDTGPGLPAETAARLFQPYTQADVSTSRRHGGTGLGLVISRRLALLLGGDITVTSQPGAGATFTLSIAVELAQAAAPVERTAATATPPPPAADILQGLRLLLAEDGPDNQRLIAFILRKAGAEVTVVENGRLAVDAALLANPTTYASAPVAFDLILMDMQMPLLDGYGATRELRAAGFTRPIIALTAHAAAGDREKCLAAGCDAYAAKPIDRPKLLRLIAEHARARQSAPR